MWRVLLADDEPFVREGLKELIPWGELGYELSGAYKNGQELLNEMPSKRPDLVILDIKMPVLGGLEAARIISEEYPQVQVILLTAYAEFQYAQQAIAYGVQRYVMKRNVLEDLPDVLTDVGRKMKQSGSAEKEEQLRLIVERVVEAMEAGDDALCAGEFQNFRLELRNSPEIRVRSAYLLLLAQCRRICREYGWELSEATGVREEETDEKVLRTGSLPELEGWMEKCILAVAGQMRCGLDNADDLVERTRKFVEKNYCRKLTLEEIAGAVYANSSYLSRLYKQKTGENLFDTINRRRVETARQLIAKGEKKIFEIAAMVGVEDTAYFSKVFKKYTGCSPKEYEKMSREEPRK